MKSKIISTSLIISSKIWTCIDVRLIYHRRPNAVSFNDAKDIIQPIPCSARDTNVISNEWRMFRRTEISFESITFEIRWSNCNSMVSLARDTIEVRIIDKYWWARRGDLERWKVERIKAGWRIFSVEHKEYRERERERVAVLGAIDAGIPLNDSIEPTFISPATDRFSSRTVSRHAVENDAYWDQGIRGISGPKSLLAFSLLSWWDLHRQTSPSWVSFRRYMHRYQW